MYMYTFSICISLVNVLISCGKADSVYDCNFENGFCTWSQDKNDTFDWIQIHGITSSIGTGPSVDHTYGTARGHYIYIEASSPRNQGDEARLISSQITSTSPQCLQFWYHMYGRGIGSLNVYLIPGSQIWTHSGNLGDRWNFAEVDIQRNTTFSIVFEGVRGESNEGDIGLDDITVTEETCKVNYTSEITTSTYINKFATDNSEITTLMQSPIHTSAIDRTAFSSYDCNFEHGFCSWSQAKNDNFDWTRNRGPTVTKPTGPSVDHTYGTASGYYIYIETSKPRRPDDKAKLVSIPITSTDPNCLQFWYHMFGYTVGSLNVKLIPGSQIWGRYGNLGDQWNFAAVDIQRNITYSIVFEGVRGTDYEGDIGLDDIEVKNGTCQEQQYPETTTFINELATDKTGSISYDCDFEHGFCSWSQDNSDIFDWSRINGPTPSSNTGPFVDHTYWTAKGYYIYIEASSPRNPGDIARLISSPITSNNPKCLQFWYHMDGRGIGSLNVYLKPGSKIWTRSGILGYSSYEWKLASVDVQSSITYSIVFEGVRGSSYLGDIGLDDIRVKNGTCKGHQSQYVIKTTTTTASTDNIVTTATTTTASTDNIVTNKTDFQTNYTQEATTYISVEKSTSSNRTGNYSIEENLYVNCAVNSWDIQLYLPVLNQLYPDYKTSDIYLGQESCTGHLSRDYLIFNQSFTDCKDKIKVNENNIIYSNELVYAIRDQNYRFMIQEYRFIQHINCSQSSEQTVIEEIKQEHGKVDIQKHQSNVSKHSILCIAFYENSTFNQLKDEYPFSVNVGENVYVKVFTNIQDSNVKMRLVDCYTKPTLTASERYKFFLIRNGCTMNQNTHIISQFTHETRFQFQDFEYSTNHESMYLYCTSKFCSVYDNSSSCNQVCYQRKRKLDMEPPDGASQDSLEHQTYKHIIRKRSLDSVSAVQHQAWSYSISTSACVFLFGCIIIGMLLSLQTLRLKSKRRPDTL